MHVAGNIESPVLVSQVVPQGLALDFEPLQVSRVRPGAGKAELPLSLAIRQTEWSNHEVRKRSSISASVSRQISLAAGSAINFSRRSGLMS